MSLLHRVTWILAEGSDQLYRLLHSSVLVSIGSTIWGFIQYLLQLLPSITLSFLLNSISMSVRWRFFTFLHCFLWDVHCAICCRLSFLSAIQCMLARGLCTRLCVWSQKKIHASQPDHFVIPLELKAYETDAA